MGQDLQRGLAKHCTVEHIILIWGVPIELPSLPLQVFLELQALSQCSDRAFVLNPVVGPEPITGVEVLM